MALFNILEKLALRKDSNGNYILADRDSSDDKDFIVYIEEKRFSNKTTLKSFARSILKKDILVFATQRFHREDGSTSYSWPPVQGSAFQTLVAQGIINVPETPKPTLNI